MDFCLELMGFGTFVRKVTVKGTSFLHVLYFTSGLVERQARSVYEKVIIEMDGQKNICCIIRESGISDSVTCLFADFGMFV